MKHHRVLTLVCAFGISAIAAGRESLTAEAAETAEEGIPRISANSAFSAVKRRLGFAHSEDSALQASAAAFDWPQWQGPERTGVSKETGLLQQWPAAGPPIAWSIAGLGTGYGSLAIKGDRIYVQSLNSSGSSVLSLNRADGKTVWAKSLGRGGSNDRGPGPRGTPTVDGDRIYAVIKGIGASSAQSTLNTPGP